MSNPSQIESLLMAMADVNDGHLTPDAVVEAARDPDSILHPHFTWSDTEAAHKQRLSEARALIRSVRVIVRTVPFVVHAPKFVRDPVASPLQGYVSLSRLATDEDNARAAVIAEFGRAIAALARAKAIAAALNMQDEIEAVERQIEELEGAARRATG